MDNQIIKDFYDVVIVGAGIAGLECAKNLSNSNLSVLVVEKNKNIGEKVCAGGVIPSDMMYIHKSFLNFSFQKMLIHYKNKTVLFPKNGNFISTINRKRLSQFQLNFLKKSDNIKILTGVSVSRILSNNFLELDSGKRIKFRFLIGADGATSVVRKYLNLLINKLEIAFQYIIPKKFKNFEVYLDDKLFGTGFLWIFLHKNFTSIGCGSDIKFINPKQLKSNFDVWLKENNINVSNAKFEAAVLNYDYRGYKFGNIFLAGDAAGLTSGITGKGIYSAFLSGKQIAKDILQKDNAHNLITNWLKKKKQQEKYMFFLKNSFLRNLFFSIAMKLISYKKVQERVIRLIT